MSYTFDDEDNEEYVYSSEDEEEMSDEYDMVDHYGNCNDEYFCGNLSDEEDFDEALYSCRDFFHNQENTLPDEEEYDDDFYTLSPNEVNENVVITSEERVRMVIWSDLLPTMKQQISEVIEVLGIPASAASVLMREFRWSKEQLMEEFTNNPELVKRMCGVYNRCSESKTDKQSIARTRYALYSRQSTPEKMRFCEICFEDGGFAPEDMIAMPCGHEFCRDCWRGFINNMLREGTVCLTYTCPQVGCNEKVTEEEVQKAAPNLLSKYREHQLKAFAETNMHSRWCPGKGCNRVAVGNPHLSASGKVVCGDCDSTFCFKCGEEPHSPLTCHDLIRWKDKCKNESETAKWIIVYTKTCPKCKTRIEKNGGCNHMTCRKCKYEFCWICMKNWRTHTDCNTFTSKDGDDPSDGTIADSKRELERYLHHYERYQAHDMAQQVAEKAKHKFVDDELGNQSSPNAFLKDAHDQLVECRRVLKYTFSFAYLNMTDASNDVEKRTFEYHQGMLERFTENLSELCEKAFEEVDSAEVINLTRVVEGFIQNVLTHVENSVGEYTPKITSAQNNGSLLKQKLKLPSMPMTRHLFRRERSN